jgi:hypothetical protein
VIEDNVSDVGLVILAGRGVDDAPKQWSRIEGIADPDPKNWKANLE